MKYFLFLFLNLSIALAQSNFADINGIKIHYQTFGRESGVPLVLLHGGGSSINVTWGRIIPFLAPNHRIIAIDEQAHGKSGDRNGPVSFETSADDVAKLLNKLNVPQADVFGFSNGASVAIQVAIRHPKLVRKLIFASSMTKKAGAYPEFWKFMEKADFSNMPQELKDAFLKETPDPAKLRNMHDKDAQRMKTFKDIPDFKVKSIMAPTLILMGNSEMVKPEHGLELSRMIKKAQLAILPSGHGQYLGELLDSKIPSRYPEFTAYLVTDFLTKDK